MIVIRDLLFIFAVMQVLFGYIEYRYKPDIIYILGRLLNPKYLVPSIIIPVAYVVLKWVLYFLFAQTQ